MSALTRVLKDPVGMASLVTNYSRIKEMQAKGLELEDIAEIFDQDLPKLKNFTEMADSFVSGENSLAVDVATKNKRAFEVVSEALAK